MNLCECGCGLRTPIAKQSNTKRGYVRGQPMRFAFGHHARVPVTKLHRQTGTRGQYLHRVLAARALGKPLTRGVEVHHVDGDISSMRPRLVICQDKAYHKMLHVRERVVRAGGNPNAERICSSCRRLKVFTEYNIRRGNKGTGLQAHCRECSKAYDAAKRRAKTKAEAA